MSKKLYVKSTFLKVMAINSIPNSKKPLNLKRYFYFLILTCNR